MTARWDVRDYRTARAALTHPSLCRSPALRGATDPLEWHVLNLDGADHQRVRAALDAALTRRTPALIPRIRPLAAQLVRGLDGEVDVAGSFVRPLVLLLLDELLGLGGDQGALRRWHDIAIAMDTRPTSHVTPSVRAQIGDLIAAKRRMPDRDLISDLACDPGVESQEVPATALFAFLAGYVNTANFLGLALLALARNPQQYDWLRAHPHTVPDAVTELLRYAEPADRAAMRVASVNAHIAGVDVAAGTTVWIHRRTAGRDPARFADPDVLNLRRERPAESLAFGAGVHYCPAAGLVRLIADSALLAVLQQIRSLSVTAGTPMEWDFGDELPLLVAATEQPV